jgi:hypothetical protein
VAQGVGAPTPRSDGSSGIDDPVQRQILRDQLDRVAEEKRLALQDPGPTWREWFYDTAAKWWIGVGFLIVDSWIIVEGFDTGNPIWVIPAVIVALYLEFLVFQYLWRRPNYDAPRRRQFRPSWYAPVPYGRWTPEAEAARADPSSVVMDDAPRPEEFL